MSVVGQLPAVKRQQQSSPPPHPSSSLASRRPSVRRRPSGRGGANGSDETTDLPAGLEELICPAAAAVRAVHLCVHRRRRSREAFESSDGGGGQPDFGRPWRIIGDVVHSSLQLSSALRQPDGRTDRRTDGLWVRYLALAGGWKALECGRKTKAAHDWTRFGRRLSGQNRRMRIEIGLGIRARNLELFLDAAVGGGRRGKQVGQLIVVADARLPRTTTTAAIQRDVNCCRSPARLPTRSEADESRALALSEPRESSRPPQLSQDGGIRLVISFRRNEQQRQQQQQRRGEQNEQGALLAQLQRLWWRNTN